MVLRLLRDYQSQAHDEVRLAWQNNKAPLIVLPPGAGKSFTALDLLSQMINNFGFKVNLVVRKRDLVEQLEADAQDFGLDYGVYMAGHAKFNPSKPLQICSIDTLNSRKDYPHLNSANVINWIDEADESLASGFQEFIAAYKNAYLGGMTATPYNGLSHFDVIVSPDSGQADALRDRGILVDYKYLVPEEAIDTSDIEIKNGEYIKEQVDKKVTTRKAVADAVKAWIKYGDFRITLGYASNVSQSKQIVDGVNAYYGHTIAAHSDASTSKQDRKRLVQLLKNGSLKLLMNVGLYLRGTNIPEIGCILNAALTAKMGKHVQVLGRGSRDNDIYDDCLIIDVAQNCMTLGPYYMDRRHLIDLKKPLRLTRELLDAVELMRRCKDCFGAFEPKDFIGGKCPRCGVINLRPVKKKSVKDMQFTELSSEAIELQMIISEFKKVLWQKRNLGQKIKDYKTACRAAHIDLYKKYGLEKMEKLASALNIDTNMIEIWRKNYERNL